MANYNSTYSGQEVDNAVGRALPDGTIDVDIRGKQDKLSQSQINAVNSGINATKVAKYDGYEQDIEDKQDKLPDVQNDKYLHTNALTGELEWKTGISKGTDDYNDLINKPTINGEEIVGDVSLEDLNVQEQLTQEQLDAVNSEVTSEWKNTIDGDITSLEVGKQDALSQEQLSKINRALVSPIATSTEKRIVAVDEQNNQVQVKIGENLSIEGTTSPFTLKAQGGGGESKLVEVTYGVTTYNEIQALVDSGKIPYCYYTNRLYTFEYYTLDGYHLSFQYGEINRLVRINSDNEWRVINTQLEKTYNKEDAISPTSTIKYPTSKAVADYVAQHSGGGWTLLWENASPGSAFNPQTLNFTSQFNNIVIEFRLKYSDTTPKEFVFIKRDSTNNTKVSKMAIYNDGTTGQKLMICERTVEARSINTTNGVIISSAHLMTFDFSSDSIYDREINNTYLIPLKIYGFN